VVIADHIVFPVTIKSKYPYTVSGAFPGQGDALEQLSLMAFVAGKSRTLRLISSVMILPHRNPVVTAKMLATIDVLSRGRVTVGVGVGWLREEFEALGAQSFDRRGAVSDEYLRIFKTLWTQDPASFRGEFYRFESVRCLPHPVQKPHPPIWVGGHSKAAVRRAVRHGDAWHPTRQTPDYVAQHLPYLRDEAELIGRDPKTVTISLKRALHFTDIGLSGHVLRRSGGSLIGTTQEVIDDARRCRDLGIEQLTYDFRTGKVDEMLAIIEHLASAVMPRV
jgi:probable F420-dependent oxidoreductase